MSKLAEPKPYLSLLIIPDCATCYYPYKKAKTEDELEGERRLFYVAMTRAREALYLLKLENKEESPYLTEMLTPVVEGTKHPRPLQHPRGAAAYWQRPWGGPGEGWGGPNARPKSGAHTRGRKASPVVAPEEQQGPPQVRGLPTDRGCQDRSLRSSRSLSEHFEGVDISNLPIGSSVVHKKYGTGEIVANNGASISIYFKGSGKTKLFPCE